MEYDFRKPALTKTVIILLSINILLYLLQIMPGIGDSVTFYLADIPLMVFKGQIWRIFSYGFIHSTDKFGHIFFNMIGLIIFASSVERRIGTKRFIFLYFFAILFSGLIALFYYFKNPMGMVLGASGGMYALLVYYAILFPKRDVMFMAMIPVNVRVLVALFGIFALGSAIVDSADGIAHLAHLGGIAAAFIFHYIDQKIRMKDTIVSPVKKKKTHLHYYEPRKSRQEIKSENEQVDEVLKKIAQTGMQSLSDDEYRILEKASGKPVKRK